MIYSEVRDVTKVGGVVYAVGGTSTINATTSLDTPFIWTSSGGMTAIPQLVTSTTGNGATMASAITPDGQYIAGRSHFDTTTNLRTAVLVTTSGLTSTNLGTLVSGKTSTATVISDDHSIAYGFAIDNSNNTVAVRYNGGSVTQLPSLAALPGATSLGPAGARSVSSNGNILVGTASTGTFAAAGNRAFIWDNNATTMSAVPLLTGGTWNGAIAVNAAGTLGLFGGDSTANPNSEVYLWNGSITPLGSPQAGWVYSGGGGLTANGSIVAAGFSPTVNAANSTFIHNSSGWFDLASAATSAGVNLTNWSNLNVFGMSSDGTLLWGNALHNGNTEGFVVEFSAGYLTAIPEPSTYAAILGFIGLGAGLWRRRSVRRRF
jgi:uncharacterized membrane protein